MGKLHTLRRAIEREPEKWHYFDGLQRRRAYGAERKRWRANGQWEPSNGYTPLRSYRSFVKKVLIALGYEMAT